MNGRNENENIQSCKSKVGTQSFVMNKYIREASKAIAQNSNTFRNLFFILFISNSIQYSIYNILYRGKYFAVVKINFGFRSQSNPSEKPAVSRNRKLNSLRSFRSNAGFQPSLTSATPKIDFLPL